MALTDKLTAIADAIRGKTGKADPLTLEQMVTEIAGIEVGGGGGAFLGDYQMVYGQITPNQTGNIEVEADFPGIIKFAALWIADPAVVTEKYGSANIMLEAHSAFVGREKEIHYASNGRTAAVVKTAFGVHLNDKLRFFYESHANWPGQPETYNWIALCEV